MDEATVSSSSTPSNNRSPLPHDSIPSENSSKHRQVYRSDVCPLSVLEQIRGRYNNVRKSKLPLIEATKQIVFVDLLIGLLSEEGFDFRQGIDGKHLLVDKTHGNKVYVEIIDEEEENDENVDVEEENDENVDVEEEIDENVDDVEEEIDENVDDVEEEIDENVDDVEEEKS
ncbi:6025_t:CDS:1 [Acaulospora colombiana]|uniref:6025_t:CDS:1 n=1 Tax=Acaulospora colombiana TaxID=27376 RepID=A0ACA9KWN9_9GLOM|nr:6025_t:CDS:1 [Acaulospora colombiana]